MRSARNDRKGFGGQSRIKQFRGRVGQHRVIRKVKLSTNASRSFLSGARSLNQEISDVPPGIRNTQFQQRRQKGRRFFKRRGIRIAENVGLVGNSPSFSSSLASAPNPQSSFIDPMIRGRLKTNYGFMRSDTVAQKQQLRRELEKARVQQKLQLQQMQQLHRAQQRSQQQQQWLRRSLKQLNTKTAKQQNNSSRTAIYSPATALTVHIPNVLNSGNSDVQVMVGKPFRKQSRALDQRDVGWEAQSTMSERRRHSAVSFEDSVGVDKADSSSNQDDYPEVDILVV